MLKAGSLSKSLKGCCVIEKISEEQSEMGGEVYQSAKEMLNDKVFRQNDEVVFGIDKWNDELVVSSVLMETPENAARAFGTEDCIKVCDARVSTAKVSTAKENEDLYDRVNDILLDSEDEAANEGKRAEAQRAEMMRRALDSLILEEQEVDEDGSVQALESAANHKIAKETKKYLMRLDAGSMTDELKEEYAEKVTALSEVREFLGFQRKLLREEASGGGEDVSQGKREEKAPVSYDFESGLVGDAATIMVGQEIPENWFETKTTRDKKGDFEISTTQSPRIEEYLSAALNQEFGKLSEEERQRYNYSATIKALEEEARRTKKFPDIIATMEANRTR